MKRIITFCMLLSAMMMATEVQAQGFLGNLFNALKGGETNTEATTETTSSTPVTETQSTEGNVAGDLLGGLLGTLAGTGSTSANEDGTALSTGGIVSGLLGSVLNAFTTVDQNTLIGTWNFKGSAFVFESEKTLANLGSDVIATQIEDKVDQYLAKFNIKEGMCTLTFNKDNTCTLVAGRRTLNGTYAYNVETKELTLTYAGMFTTTAYLVYDAGVVNILYQSDGLLNILKAISSTSTTGTLSMLKSLLNQYNGLRIGMAFGK